MDRCKAYLPDILPHLLQACEYSDSCVKYRYQVTQEATLRLYDPYSKLQIHDFILSDLISVLPEYQPNLNMHEQCGIRGDISLAVLEAYGSYPWLFDLMVPSGERGVDGDGYLCLFKTKENLLQAITPIAGMLGSKNVGAGTDYRPEDSMM